jgi:hypothetical protein
MTQITGPEFERIWKECQSSPSLVAQRLGKSVRNILTKRDRLEEQGYILPTLARTPSARIQAEKFGTHIQAHAYTPMAKETVKGGTAIVFGDAHYWPGERSLAHEALCILSKRLGPKLIIGNGDLFDGAGISRHDVLGWQKLPTVAQELDAVRTSLDQIKRACPKARTRSTVGNHDSRFDRRLATETPQFQEIHGMRLEDHLKDWPMSYAVLINEDIDPVFVTHNVKGGIHATWNNTASTGCHVVTGHLHDQNERTRSFLFKEAVGIDHGCLADVDHEAFSYRMGRPSNWRSGFVVLSFDSQGRLFPAEFCRVQIYGNYKRAIFRGEVVCERRVKSP